MYTLRKAEISSTDLLQLLYKYGYRYTILLLTPLIHTAWSWLLCAAETWSCYYNHYNKIVYWWFIFLSLYRVRTNYRRILQNHIFTNTVCDFFLWGFVKDNVYRPTTSKDNTRIARAHQLRNGERHTWHAWEGLVRMGVSPGHLPCHTRGAHRTNLRSLSNCKHSSFKW